MWLVLFGVAYLVTSMAGIVAMIVGHRHLYEWDDLD